MQGQVSRACGARGWQGSTAPGSIGRQRGPRDLPASPSCCRGQNPLANLKMPLSLAPHLNSKNADALNSQNAYHPLRVDVTVTIRCTLAVRRRPESRAPHVTNQPPNNLSGPHAHPIKPRILCSRPQTGRLFKTCPTPGSPEDAPQPCNITIIAADFRNAHCLP